MNDSTVGQRERFPSITFPSIVLLFQRGDVLGVAVVPPLTSHFLCVRRRRLLGSLRQPPRDPPGQEAAGDEQGGGLGVGVVRGRW